MYVYMFSFLFTITHTITMPCYTEGSKLIIALHYCCFHQIFYVASGNVKTTVWGNWFNMISCTMFVNG